jgi:hypothetical protein
MGAVIDAFWRAAAYCLHPRVIALSFLPLIITIAAALGLGYFFWDQAVDVLRQQLETWAWVHLLYSGLETIGLGGLRSVMAPAMLLFLCIPFIIMACLLMVAVFMTPAMVSLVGERRFAQLERKKGASLVASILWSLGSTLAACVALVLSLPLWLVPPLVLILPPLIWGWLNYRVMAFDCLADHASAQERQRILLECRVPLLFMGLFTGYLGALPSVLWASGAMFIAMAPVLLPLAIWIYTLIFAFSSLWFSHYCLTVLDKTRRDAAQAQTLAACEIGSQLESELGSAPAQAKGP